MGLNPVTKCLKITVVNIIIDGKSLAIALMVPELDFGKKARMKVFQFNTPNANAMVVVVRASTYNSF